MANILSNEYVNAFSSPKQSEIVSDPSEFFIKLEEDGGFNDICITVDEVRNALKSFRRGASPGPDGIPADILIECSDELAPALMELYQRSFDTGEIPEILKLSKIVPLHKGNGRQHAKNYRPISLTSHLGKGMEKVFKNHLVRYLENHDLLNEHQHGFRSQRSTFSQLVRHVEEVLSRLEDGGLVDVVYLDFARAFDKVDHGVLLSRIKSLNISGKAGIWISEFLTGRKQYVTIGGESSDLFDIISGVPQGTVLGPILFLVLLTSRSI